MIVNLTPHSITFVDACGNVIKTVEPSGQVARVTAKTVSISEVDGIPITTTAFGDIEGLPAPNGKDVYVVSSIVAQRCRNRDDVFVPSESVRDGDGRIIGCRSLGVVS